MSIGYSLLLDDPFSLVLALLAVVVAIILLDRVMLSNVLAWFHGGSSQYQDDDRPSKRKSSIIRTRAQQAEKHDIPLAKPRIDDGVYRGLVNISGTYCFMNSTLQALASLSYLHPHIQAIHKKAELWDVPTPVVDNLLELLDQLNTPLKSSSALRPVPMIEALSGPNEHGTRSRLFSSREHQDAQELFQLLSSLIQEEASAVDSESLKDAGLATFDSVLAPNSVGKREAAKGVFEGFTANRRSCVECGYTEAVMHFSFDNLTLPVPRASSCTIEECLAAYTTMEFLNDCICRKCSMLATVRKLKAEVDRLLSTSDDQPVTSARKTRARQTKKLQQKVQEALDQRDIEQDIKGVKLEKVVSSCSTKQVMIARPPPILALHLNRSSYFGAGYASKNSCRVEFPEILNLTPYTTSGQLSTAPSAPISAHTTPNHSRNSSVGPAGEGKVPLEFVPTQELVLYRLAAVVCHYGGHSFGHYVAFRRKPRSPLSKGSSGRFPPPRLVHPLNCTCSLCAVFSPIRDEDETDVTRPRSTNEGWLKISDDSVEEVGLGRVLRETVGTFMLYYERVQVDSDNIEKEVRGRKVKEVEKASAASTVSTSNKEDGLLGDEVELKTVASHGTAYYTAINGGASATFGGRTPSIRAYSLAEPGPSSPRSSQETIKPENLTSSPGRRSHPNGVPVALGRPGVRKPMIGDDEFADDAGTIEWSGEGQTPHQQKMEMELEMEDRSSTPPLSRPRSAASQSHVIDHVLSETFSPPMTAPPPLRPAPPRSATPRVVRSVLTGSHRSSTSSSRTSVMGSPERSRVENGMHKSLPSLPPSFSSQSSMSVVGLDLEAVARNEAELPSISIPRIHIQPPTEISSVPSTPSLRLPRIHIQPPTEMASSSSSGRAAGSVVESVRSHSTSKSVVSPTEERGSKTKMKFTSPSDSVASSPVAPSRSVHEESSRHHKSKSSPTTENGTIKRKSSASGGSAAGTERAGSTRSRPRERERVRDREREFSPDGTPSTVRVGLQQA
ncbi:hypothetical protein FRC02_012314 [Tulasnella sp. 418]|nr:hypothetical protein FRC02_012314 [Tulasnella sp. 418]